MRYPADDINVKLEYIVGMNANETSGDEGSLPELEIALGTPIPPHFREGSPKVIDVAFSRGHNVVLIGSINNRTPCGGMFPDEVDTTADGELYTACGCGMTFVWSRLTRGWS